MQKIACQSITWGNLETREAMQQMLKEISACGYHGVEIGVQCVELIGGRSVLEDLGLELAALHTGGDFRGKDIDKEADYMKEVAESAKSYGADLVFFSGMNFHGKGEEDYREEAAWCNRFGEAVHSSGLHFCYHNHHWEFKKNGLGMRVLLSETDPNLVSLVPDIGWVYRGDVEPVDFVRDHADRIKALHFKEFTFDEHFTELGKGMVPFEPVFEWAQGKDLWIVAEQDICTGKPVDSARENAAYLKRLTQKYQQRR